MSDSLLAYEKNEHIAIIRIANVPDWPERFPGLSGELSGVCETIAADDDIRVVILAGAHKQSFSFEQTSPVTALAWNYTLPAELIAGIEQPVIAAINGDAAGNGFELVLACDIRIAVKDAGFCLPQVAAGGIPFEGGTQRLPRIIGRGKALEMILTGEKIDADEAYRLGLINRIAAPDELMPMTVEIAEKMASKGPIALKYVKEAINKGMDMTLFQGMQLEADLYFLLHTTADRTEGVKAFQEKRKPEFKGK